MGLQLMNDHLRGETVTIPAAFVYRWMAGLYLAAPDAEGLAAYRTSEGETLLDRLAQIPALSPLIAELRDLTGPGCDLEDAATRLSAAHSAAFLTGGRRSAPPYASVWLSERGLMYQAPARAMTRLLAETGLTLPDDVPEPPDHIGFQLNLLAELDQRARAGIDVPLAPETFIRDHMLSWLPDFAMAAASLRKPLLYAALAVSTLDYLSEIS